MLTDEQRQDIQRAIAVFETLRECRSYEKVKQTLRTILAASAGQADEAEEMRDAAMRTVQAMGLVYTKGADRWKPQVAAPTPAAAQTTKKTPSDYLDAPGMWAQVYCCGVFVRGFPSDMARSAADEAVKEFGAEPCKTAPELECVIGEVLRVD